MNQKLTAWLLCLASLLTVSTAHSAEDSGEDPAPEKPISSQTLDRELGSIRGQMFNVEGETLEDRQNAFREKLVEAFVTVDSYLAEDQPEANQIRLYKFKTELFRYGIKLSVPQSQEKLETLLAELKDSELASLREVARREGLMYELDSFSTSPPERQQRLLSDSVEYVTSLEPNSETNLTMMTISRQISTSKVPHETALAHQQFADHLAKSDDKKLKAAAEKLRATGLRLDLPGKPLELTGTTIAGESFDLKDLQGKVVLVDFWATWCGPCIAEFPKMKELHAKHHDAGFEIVGISLDDNHEHLVKYMEINPVPWTILHEALKEGDRGWDHPAAKKYGISAIPCMLLIGRDGNVITTHARGEELEQLMETLFPEEAPSQS
ncbi:TlpA disulfide reductase family protein [Bremerella sp. JC817]|uniref:TlpA family protein disulfide reductase n=1 Tax=Bremerella sp. JC817 TaxID=3231756 RepID=UPI0034574482